MESTLEGKYNPKDFEQKIYNDWEEKGYFKPKYGQTKTSFCICNATTKCNR